jgi:hypothetical protein
MQRHTDDVKIESLLRRAADYAAHSVTNVICKLDDGQDEPRKVFYDCLEQMHELEVHFLFPNLSERHREVLVRLLNARRALAARLGLSVHRPSAHGPKGDTALLTRLKRQFMELEARGQKVAEETSLTPFQKQILEREFLSLPSEG